MLNQEINIKEGSEENKGSENFLNTYITAFITVFLAELGDKTQIATLLLSAESGNPTLVFIGAALALITTSLLGVALGTWLSEKLPEYLLNNAAGLIMLIIGIYLIIEILTSENFLERII